MTDTLALEKLYNDVVARFAAEGTNAANAFGWRAPDVQKAEERRLCWIPGGPGGALGEIGEAKQPGRNPRPLATVFEQFTVEIGAVDVTQPEIELAQYKATRLLFDTWLRACRLSAGNTFRVLSSAWDTSKKVRQFGTLLRVVCTVEAMVPDVVHELVPTDAKAKYPITVLDNTSPDEEITAASPPPS